MQARVLRRLALLFVTCILSSWHVSALQQQQQQWQQPTSAKASTTVSGPGPIATVNDTYRVFVAKTHDPAWVNGTDTLLDKGFDMVAVQGGKLRSVASVFSTPLGKMELHAEPPLYHLDFYAEYKQPTFWPYCQILELCLVYSQQEETDPDTPVVLTLPAGTGAFDFYIDLAIDCVTVLKANIPCTVGVEPGGLEVHQNVDTICDSAVLWLLQQGWQD